MTRSDTSVQKALKAEIYTNELNAKEQKIFFERFTALMWKISEKPPPEQKTIFKNYIANH